MSDSVTIKVVQTLSCGHVIEQVVHVKLDGAFYFSLKQDFPVMETPKEGEWNPPVVPEPTLTLNSHYEKVEITGIALKDRKFVCSQCGKDVLFPNGARVK